MIAHGGHEMDRPLSVLHSTMQLDLAQLPGYAVLTTLRMFAALAASLLFTFVVATLAAKSRKAELVIVPSARHSAVGAGAGFSRLHHHLLHGAVSQP